PVSDSPTPRVPSDAELRELGSGIRLVAVDMDGTLLDGNHEVPESIWPLVAELGRRGIVWCPASGRQYATLARDVVRAEAETVVIAENGAFVVRDGVEISSDVMARDIVVDAVGAGRRLAAGGLPVGTVVCGKHTAYIERTDQDFRTEVDRYYAEVTVVDDLLAVDDGVLKVALHDAGPAAETTYPALAHLAETHQVVVSGAHWVDVMNSGVHKGAALQSVQRALGIGSRETVAFGDYLNDLHMLGAADLSFAMANAHPRIRATARFGAPANTEDGVARILAGLLGVGLTAR
uniref:HAD hydrolase family protein n=1 Tax=Actinotalea sp. TaxID=1872145 RepID=UPI003569AF40